MTSAPREVPFFKVVVRELTVSPSLLGVCAAYERAAWRCDGLVDHLMDWLPEFCLTHSEFESLNGRNATRLIRRTAHRVYETKKFRNRGEFGELILHALLRQEFKTLPAISKVYFKDANNDTVKGFDAVHVIANGDDLELWLGESKFYTDINAAIRDVIDELHKHTTTDYLRSEFVAIENKIDAQWPHAAKLKRLLHENTSLDDVFSSLCVPVLLTYDSDTTATHTSFSDAYVQEMTAELMKHHAAFASKPLPTVKILLCLLPLATKAQLVVALDAKLTSWQNL